MITKIKTKAETNIIKKAKEEIEKLARKPTIKVIDNKDVSNKRKNSTSRNKNGKIRSNSSKLNSSPKMNIYDRAQKKL